MIGIQSWESRSFYAVWTPKYVPLFSLPSAGITLYALGDDSSQTDWNEVDSNGNSRSFGFHPH